MDRKGVAMRAKGMSVLAGVCLTGLGLGPLAAQGDAIDATDDVQSHFSVLGSYIWADEDRGLNVDRAGGIVVQYGRQYRSRFGWEAALGSETIETDTTGVTDFYRYHIGLHVSYALADRSGFTPFLLLGGGANYNDVQNGLLGVDDAWDAFATAGLGFVTAPLFRDEWFRLRGEVRYVHDRFMDGVGDVRASLGVEIPMRRRQAPAPALGMAVEERVRVVEAELADSDHDGIPDVIDECPGTPVGTRVDPRGCPLGRTLLLDGVVFAFDSHELQLNARRLLNPVVEMFHRYPDLEAEVGGHTDSLGSSDYNRALSERRARAVRDYLVSQGVSARRLSARGYGKDRPVADNSSESGREQNRRVELRILN